MQTRTVGWSQNLFSKIYNKIYDIYFSTTIFVIVIYVSTENKLVQQNVSDTLCAIHMSTLEKDY